MTSKAAKRIQSKADRTGKNQGFKRRAMKAAGRKISQKVMYDKVNLSAYMLSTPQLTPSFFVKLVNKQSEISMYQPLQVSKCEKCGEINSRAKRINQNLRDNLILASYFRFIIVR